MPENESSRTEEVTVTHADGTKMRINVLVGANLQDALEIAGEDAVFYLYAKGAATQARNKLRSLTHVDPKRGGKAIPADEALAQMANWVPTKTEGRRAKDPITAIRDTFEKLDDEGRRALIESLKAELAKVGANV